MKRLAAIAAMKLSLYLKDKADDSLFEKYKRLLDKSITAEYLAEVMEIPLFDENNEVSNRLKHVVGLCGENETARTCIELSVLFFMEKSTAELIKLICGYDYLTVESAAMLTHGSYDVFDYVDEMLDAYKRIELLLSVKTHQTDFIHAPLNADARLILYMNGIDDVDEALGTDLSVKSKSTHMPFTFEDELNKLTDRLDFLLSISEPRIVVHISGEKLSGRLFSADFAAQRCGLKLYTVEFDLIMYSDKPIETIRKLMSEALLCDSCLCIHNVIKTNDTEAIMKRLFKEYERFTKRPFFILSDRSVKLIPFYDATYVLYDIPQCTPYQSMCLWDGFIQKYCYNTTVNNVELASKMCLTAGQIERIVKALVVSDNVGDTNSKEIFKLCYKILDDGRYDNIKRVEAGYTLDDLKLDEKNKQQLRDICNQVEYRQRVYGDWGMARKYAYGRCVSAIFSGPPGTGKTMAVHVLSSMLGLELFKVDLSQLVDKYIGETEKRLEEVFSRAEKSNMILFFDEADSVMGKRSEVNDSKDKYANTEISFILQRMEEYDGIVILATNYIQNIDTAFMRRIRYVVNFPIPDKNIRKQIWVSAFSESIPLDDEIDFDFLAEKFELAGGNIKNIVLNATFFAAAENRPVEMKHILRAIHRENTKDKRVSFLEDYEHYAYLLE